MTANEISARIRTLSIKGFGGKCFSAALVINEKVFGGKGSIVGWANKFWCDRCWFIGHVAVEVDGIYWDMDAFPKDLSDMEEWGMIDVNDPDYFHPDLDEIGANEVVALNAKQLYAIWKCDMLEVIIGEGYRRLQFGEKLKTGDEIWVWLDECSKNGWMRLTDKGIKVLGSSNTIDDGHAPVRRLVK